MSKLRVGIIGLGVGEKHLAAFESHPACTVTSLCDFNEEKLSTFDKKGAGRYRLIKNADELLSDPTLDLISIASWDHYHAEQIVKALHNRKHVFAEKPLCLHRREMQEIQALLRAHPKLKLSSNLILRTVPRFEWLRQRMREGLMGRIFYIEADYLWGRFSKLERGWRGQMPYYSIILGAAVHMIDLVLWLRPRDPVRAVFAAGNAIATAGTNFPFNDFAVITLTFESGLIAKITGNAGAVTPHFHRLEVYGTRETFFNDPEAGRLFRSSEPGHPPEVAAAEYPGHQKHAVIHSFVDWVQEERTPLVSAEEVFDTMAICLAADESMKTKEPVEIQREEAAV